MSKLAEISNEREYAGLLATALPHVIHTEQENERCIAVLEAILEKSFKTQEERRLQELLILLIEDFESRKYSLEERATPVDVVRHLMEAHQLRQADLLDVFGSRSVASDVLNGKRGLSKAHIQRLAARFHVSPGVFFPAGPQGR